MPLDHDELIRALHDTHAPALFRYAVRLTSDHALAQDVVQESLLRAWKHPTILEQGDEAARAWLFTVVRNLIIDDRRSAHFTHELRTDRVPDAGVPDKTEGVLNAWLLSDALSTLSVEHRKAVVSAYYLGCSVAEIARQEEIPVGTVKSRLHYALRALRLALQERGISE